MNRAELKAAAKVQISGKIGILFVVTIIISAITGVASWIMSFIPGIGSLAVSVIITPAFTLSLTRIYLSVVAGGTPEVKDTFSGFDDFWAAFKVTFLTGLFTFLWSLLFVIPGIVKAYSYSMSKYVLAENKGKSARECIEVSKKMTNGKKADLFVLDLSFIGWLLLGAVTFGIAFIWVAPYIQATKANVYNLLKPVAVVEDAVSAEEAVAAEENTAE